MVEVIPAILTSSPKEAFELIKKAQDKTERAQIDIIDGIFVDNKTINPEDLESVDTSLELDFHLMVKDPENWVERCARVPAGTRIIGQIEMMADQTGFVSRIQSFQLEAGLAVDLETAISDLDPTILTDLSVVLLMSVPAGFGGQEFDKRVLPKIKELVKVREGVDSQFEICVDGGVTDALLPELEEIGVTQAAMGRFFKIYER